MDHSRARELLLWNFNKFGDSYWEEFNKFMDYCIKDVEILEKLVNKSQVITNSIELCWELWCSFWLLMQKSLTSIVTDWICNDALKSNILYKTWFISPESKQSYDGAYNMHVAGQYNNVFKVDLSGAYPSTLIALNLSPELFIKYENVDEEKLIKCEWQSKYLHENNTKIIQIVDK